MQHKVASRGTQTQFVVRAGLEIERAVTARRGRVSGYTAFADSTPDISGEQTSTRRSLRLRDRSSVGASSNGSVRRSCSSELKRR